VWELGRHVSLLVSQDAFLSLTCVAHCQEILGHKVNYLWTATPS
jgi:hypothetical protein